MSSDCTTEIGHDDVVLDGGAAAVSSPLPAAQETRAPLGEVIDEYVRESLQSNLSLQIRVARSRAQPRLARWRPARASSPRCRSRALHARGGRPRDRRAAGHAAESRLLDAERSARGAGPARQFPQIADQTINFLREREQDTRVTVRQPIYAPAIPAAIRAQRALLEAAEFGRVARRAAPEARRDGGVSRLAEGHARPSTSCRRASRCSKKTCASTTPCSATARSTQDQVLRARAELLAVVQQLREARNGQTQARSYLNFLRNRSLDTS